MRVDPVTRRGGGRPDPRSGGCAGCQPSRDRAREQAAGIRERLDLLVRQTGDEWERACHNADTWLLRAGLLGALTALEQALDENEHADAVRLRRVAGPTVRSERSPP